MKKLLAIFCFLLFVVVLLVCNLFYNIESDFKLYEIMSKPEEMLGIWQIVPIENKTSSEDHQWFVLNQDHSFEYYSCDFPYIMQPLYKYIPYSHWNKQLSPIKGKWTIRTDDSRTSYIILNFNFLNNNYEIGYIISLNYNHQIIINVGLLENYKDGKIPIVFIKDR